MMIEEPLFIAGRSGDLFGVAHLPEATKSPGALVICAPFFEEKVIAHRAVVGLARSIALEGRVCLRFDYFGSGDSAGPSQGLTVASAIEDALSVMAWSETRFGCRVEGLIGLRFGAAVALSAAAQSGGVGRLALIDPVLDGRKYFGECLRANLATQLSTYKKIVQGRAELLAGLACGVAINVDGYLLSKEMGDQMRAVELSRLTEVPARGLHLVASRAAVRADELSALRRWCESVAGPNCRATYAEVDDNAWWKDAKVMRPVAALARSAVVAWLEGTSSQD